MAIKVKNLTIQRISGSSHVATWTFDSITASAAAGAVTAGALVSIVAGSRYANGTIVPQTIYQQRWYVQSVSGTKVILGKNESGTQTLSAAINVTALFVNEVPGYVVENTLDHFKVVWKYTTKDGLKFTASETSVTENQAAFTQQLGDNVTILHVRVTPVSKKYEVKTKVKKDSTSNTSADFKVPTSSTENQYTEVSTNVDYWTGTEAAADYYLEVDPPTTISSPPSVSLDGYELTMTVNGITDPRTDQIEFSIYNGLTQVALKYVEVVQQTATYKYTLSPGGEYKVRIRSVNIISYSGNNIAIFAENYSSYSETILAPPDKMSSFKLSSTSSTNIRVNWTAVSSATTYEIQYTTDVLLFDTSDEPTSITGLTGVLHNINGLESGRRYYFRMRAANTNGYSKWTIPKSIIIGTKPSAPTTWSSTTTVVTGNNVIFYWAHNSVDGSKERYAELEVTINGTVQPIITINNETPEEEETIRSYTYNTSSLTDGATLLWRMRTYGIVTEASDWSTQRTVTINAPATISVSILNNLLTPVQTITSFPFKVNASAGPSTQNAITFSLVIKSLGEYTSYDRYGIAKTVNSGDVVYSKTFTATSRTFSKTMVAGEVDLHSGISYNFKYTVVMSSGLSATDSANALISWTDTVNTPSAEIGINPDTIAAYIRPYCLNSQGVKESNIRLSVYRIQNDGSFVEIATDINNAYNTMVTDPHPSLDYASYRIVATSTTTGAMAYTDIPGYPVKCTSIVIQWNETITPFDSIPTGTMDNVGLSGEILFLPYNIDVSESTSADVELIEYIGRSAPVSYYGTQVGETSTWNAEILKTDIYRLNMLRKLSKWMGDVYVREPSGLGYWANVNVSFSQKHCELTIPVSLTITRVDGGV